MTDYQLKVLRLIDGERDEHTISKALHGYGNGTTYYACDRLAKAGLLERVKSEWGYAIWRRTAAGDAALVNAEKRLLPLPKPPVEVQKPLFGEGA